MKRALYIGRFQPFHNGHLRVIKNALEENDELIIIIGSSDKSFTKKNPLTAGERIEIIKQTLLSEKIKNNYYLIPIPDINTNAVWVSHVEMNVPSFSKVYAGQDITNTLFSQKGYKTESIARWHDISATKIRDMMLKDLDWKSLVPKETAKLLLKMKFLERMMAINNQN